MARHSLLLSPGVQVVMYASGLFVIILRDVFHNGRGGPCILTSLDGRTNVQYELFRRPFIGLR